MSNEENLSKETRQKYGDATGQVHAEEHQTVEEAAINPGDRIDDSKSIEEKAEQIAVDSWDPTGHVTVPTYFVVKDEDGHEEALHHVKDAEEISDVIRQARVDENGERKWW